MNATLQLSRMSRQEKLMAMEALWADLSADDRAVESPNWHDRALRETESSLAAGREQVLDWTDAKRRLRQTSA